MLDDFDIALPPNCKDLREFETPISVHVGHMTSWRDTDHRRESAGSKLGSARQRPDWDQEINILVDHVIQALNHAVLSGVPWATPFDSLRQACIALRTDPNTMWPPELTEKASVHNYLRQLGLR